MYCIKVCWRYGNKRSNKNFNDVNQSLYEEYRAEYDKRFLVIMCNGIVPSISWYYPFDFDEKPKIDKIDAYCVIFVWFH